MNKKTVTVLSVLIIVVFIAYIIYDVFKPSNIINDPKANVIPEIADAWKISNELKVNEGKLKAVTVLPSGVIYIGGDSFLSCYDKNLKLKWSVKTPSQVTSLSNYGDTIFASTVEQILVVDSSGAILNEWGPFEDSCIITSVS